MSEMLIPSTLQEAVDLMATTPAPTVLAGGTDLWPQWKAGVAPRPERVLSLHRIAELKQIAREEGWLRIGAAVTHSALVSSELVQQGAPALAEAAATIGAVQIQNRGTIGGNIINASPAADLPPPLLAAGAEVELCGPGGSRRRLPLSELYLGYRKLDRGEQQLLCAIRVPPLQPGELELFRKVGTRRAQAISKVVGACRLRLEQKVLSEARLAFGSVGPVPLQLSRLEEWLKGRALDSTLPAEAEERAVNEVKPIDDLRSSADYRRYVVGRLVRRWLEVAAER